MNLRTYQALAIRKTFEAWEEHRAVLGVAATGMGKTVLFASILQHFPGRAMVIAHREELIFQAAHKIAEVTGLTPEIEMGEIRVGHSALLPHAGHGHGRPMPVISTVQTQAARGGKRMRRFRPEQFDLLVIDEAHHAVAASYRQLIAHYRTNPNLKVLGVTATPNRADEAKLGRVFDTLAFEYDIRFGIHEGWLVPITQRIVDVQELDFSHVRTTAGDFNQQDLARLMEEERPMQAVAAAAYEYSRGRSTLVFAVSVAHATKIAEILNRRSANCAAVVHAKTDPDERREIFRRLNNRSLQFLTNVGVVTEGVDAPVVEVVVIGRPTKSTGLYMQMIGRGTRPLPGVVDCPALYGTATGRRAAIAASAKPCVEIIDLHGNCGRHKLISTVDILAGDVSQAVVERARARLLKTHSGDALEALQLSEQELQAEREKRRQADAAAAERRKHLVARAKFASRVVNPFEVLDVVPWNERDFDRGRLPSEKMIAVLRKQDIPTEGLTFTQVRQLVSEIIGRWDRNECSYRQARILRERGLPTNVTASEASKMIDEIAAQEGWKSRK